jgi:hypothetical protein
LKETRVVLEDEREAWELREDDLEAVEVLGSGRSWLGSLGDQSGAQESLKKTS